MRKWNLASLSVLIVSICLLALSGAFVFLHITGPFDGARLEPAVYIWMPDGIVLSPLFEQPDGLQPGDVLLRVEGRTMQAWADSLLKFGVAKPKWEIGQTVTYTVLREGNQLSVPIKLTRYPLRTILRLEWGAIFADLVNILITAFIFFNRPANPPARVLFLASAGTLASTSWSFGLQVSDIINGYGFWLYVASAMGGFTLLWIGALHFSLVFPRPHPVLKNRRWIIPSLYLMAYGMQIAYMQFVRMGAENNFAWLGRLNGTIGVLQLSYMALAVVALVTGYRASPDAASRLRFRWIMFPIIVIGIMTIALGSVPELLLGYPLLSWNTMALVGLILPMSIAIAILRYQLFDIDLIINRTLVYGMLTISAMGLYVLIVGYLGNLFQARDRSMIAFLTTGLVAIIFQPLRESLQRIVNRFMFGERDDPYTVLSRLRQRLETTLAPEAVMPAIVEAVAQTLKLPYAALATKQGDDFDIVASYGQAVDDPIHLPLIYQTETIGQLMVALRAPEETFTLAEQRLLEDIALQAGVAVHAVRLTDDLQRSRERLVTTREEERRRLRRDLHDGLGPELASLTLKLEAAHNILKHDPSAVDQMLLELKTQTQNAISEVRRLVYELRPPALDELGLIPAIQEYMAGGLALGDTSADNSLQISMESPDSLPPLSAAVDLAAYRIVLEALTNVIRHAQASKCVVRFNVSDELEVEVVDDGIGLQPDARAGVGLASMRERASELGGKCTIEALKDRGTRVYARLPITSSED